MTYELSYCGQVVRDYDPDRFLLSMFVPAQVRADLWALFAFNHEIAKTREVVTEAQLGLIRLQWWREAIGAFYERGAVEDHEVLRALCAVIKRHDLPRDHFDRLIYAREFDLEEALPGNVEGLLNYIDFTSTPLMKLAVQICGGDPEIEPVQPVAMNYGLVGVLRAIPVHAAQRRCYLPEDLMEKYELKTNQLFDGKGQDSIHRIVDDLVDNFVSKIRVDNPFLKVSQGFSAMYCKKVTGLKGDVFSPKMAVPPAFREIRLFLASL